LYAASSTISRDSCAQESALTMYETFLIDAGVLQIMEVEAVIEVLSRLQPTWPPLRISLTEHHETSTYKQPFCTLFCIECFVFYGVLSYSQFNSLSAAPVLSVTDRMTSQSMECRHLTSCVFSSRHHHNHVDRT